MSGMLFNVSNVIVPVLLCVLIGFGLAKLEVPFDNKMVAGLVSNVGYPTLVLSHLEERHIAFSEFLNMMLGALAAVACFGLISLAILSVLRLPRRAFLSPMMFNNVGNIGLPVSMLVFGQEGLAYAIAFVIVVLVGTFTIGMWLPMGRIKWRDVLRQPVIYAVLIAIVLMATETRLPIPIDKAFTILGGIAIPLMLLTLGHTLAILKLESIRRGSYLALLHAAMAFSVAFTLSHLFGFEGTARGVFILECMMPISVATYLWVHIHRPENAPDVASLILSSTTLTIIILPLVLTFWL